MSVSGHDIPTRGAELCQRHGGEHTGTQRSLIYVTNALEADTQREKLRTAAQDTADR